MKTFKEIKVESTQRVYGPCTCDLCKQVIKKHGKEETYSPGHLSYLVVGGLIRVDFCDACFESKIKPMLIQLGADLRTKSWDEL